MVAEMLKGRAVGRKTSNVRHAGLVDAVDVVADDVIGLLRAKAVVVIRGPLVVLVVAVNVAIATLVVAGLRHGLHAIATTVSTVRHEQSEVFAIFVGDCPTAIIVLAVLCLDGNFVGYAQISNFLEDKWYFAVRS